MIFVTISDFTFANAVHFGACSGWEGCTAAVRYDIIIMSYDISPNLSDQKQFLTLWGNRYGETNPCVYAYFTAWPRSRTPIRS